MFDSGALERGQQSIRKVHRLAMEMGYPIVVTTPVLAEWWRRGKREKEHGKLLRTLLLEPPSAYVAQLAGAGMGFVAATVVDAIVMASASIRSDTVYTSDIDDFERLREVFPNAEIAHV